MGKQMARFCPLFSGSSGNCTYIGSASGGVLVDTGVSARRIECALNEREIDPRSIQAVFITHEHTDHVSGLRVLAKRYGYKVYASAGTLDALVEAQVLGTENNFEVISEDGVETAGMYILPFHTSHDSRESLGYRVHTADGRTLAVATDTGCMTDAIRGALVGCDLVLLESNHDIRMLENGPYPYVLKRRILGERGHLSNDCCAAELPFLAQNGTTRFVLGHLSRENNFPDLAYRTSRAVLDRTGLCEGKDYLLTVAPRSADAPVMVL